MPLNKISTTAVFSNRLYSLDTKASFITKDIASFIVIVTPLSTATLQSEIFLTFRCGAIYNLLIPTTPPVSESVIETDLSLQSKTLL